MAARWPLNQENPEIGKLGFIVHPGGGNNITLQAQESGVLCTDAGGTGTVEWTLPPAAPGLHFYFMSEDRADPYIIHLDGIDVFNFPDGLVNADDTRFRGEAAAHFVCDEAGVWNFESGSGSFTLIGIPDVFWANGPFENAPSIAAGIINRREGGNAFDASANYPFVPGRDCETVGPATDLSMLGRYVRALVNGQRAWSSYHLRSGLGSSVDKAGASQGSDLHASGVTTDATWTELRAGDTGGGDSSYLRFPNNCAALLEILVVAKNLRQNATRAVGWRFRAMVTVDGSGNHTVLQPVEKERMFETALGNESDFDVRVAGQAAPGRLAVEVQGTAAVTDEIGWTATARVCEVTGYEPLA
jgi:hypothetical protein